MLWHSYINGFGWGLGVITVVYVVVAFIGGSAS